MTTLLQIKQHGGVGLWASLGNLIGGAHDVLQHSMHAGTEHHMLRAQWLYSHVTSQASVSHTRRIERKETSTPCMVP